MTRRSRGPAIESLEQRQLLSATAGTGPVVQARAGHISPAHQLAAGRAPSINEATIAHKAIATERRVAALQKAILHFEAAILGELNRHVAGKHDAGFEKHLALQQVVFARRIAREGGLYTPISTAISSVGSAPPGSVPTPAPVPAPTPSPGPTTGQPPSRTPPPTATPDPTPTPSPQPGPTAGPPPSQTQPPTATPGPTPTPTPTPAPKSPPQTLPAPTGLIAFADSSAGVDLIWTPVPRATSYLIERSTDQMFWTPVVTAAVLNGRSESASDATVSPGTPYFYRVSCVDATTTSSPGKAASVLTLPAAPALSATSESASQIVLNWSAVTGTSSYILERSSDNGSSWSTLATTGSLTFADSGLAADTNYAYRLSAVNASGISPASSIVAAVTFPAAPTGLTASAASASEIDLNWNAEPDAQAYLVQRSVDQITWTTLSIAPAITGGIAILADTSVLAGTTYDYRVSTTTAVATSQASAIVSATTLPAAPALVATAASPTEIDLNWTAIPSAASYLVERSSDGGKSWTVITSPSTAAYSDETLTANTRYEYEVAAVSPAGTSADSAPVAVTTQPLPPVNSPGTGGTTGTTTGTTLIPAPGTAWSFTPNPALPNVLILGDSISIGYTPATRSDLAGKANVYRPLNAAGTDAENCGDTTFGLANLDNWLAGKKWAVIHFNFGLHDLEHVASRSVDTPSANLNDPVLDTPRQYAANLEAIVRKLKATGAKLIFGATTPVPAGAMGRTPGEPAEYNAIALQIMHDNGVAVDDLYTKIQPYLTQYQQPQSVHYTSAGYSILARQVADSVEAALGGLS